MEEKNKNTDDKVEQVLSFFDSPEELASSEIKLITNDPESILTGQELLTCKNAVLQEYSRNVPNADREWDKFQQKVIRRSSKRLFVIGGLSGIAASFLLVVMFGWLKQTNDMHNGLVVFKANSAEQQVVLQTTSGKELVLNDATSEQMSNTFGANIVKTGKNGLAYAANTKQLAAEMYTLTTPRGMDFEVVLADGTKVWLNAESKLEYPSHFSNKERTIKLHGEAYFEVDKDKEHPFIVQTNNLKTRVLGTQFNVSNYSTTNSHVTLIEGSVEVSNSKGRVTRIKPGEDAHLQQNGAFDVKEVDVDSYIYWKDGFFYFDNVSLVDIMQSLGRWYNVNIVFSNKAAMDYKMHYLCDRKGGIEHAITLLNRMKKVELKREGNTLYIR